MKNSKVSTWEHEKGLKKLETPPLTHGDFKKINILDELDND